MSAEEQEHQDRGAHEIQKRITQLEQEVRRLREVIRDLTGGRPLPDGQADSK